MCNKNMKLCTVSEANNKPVSIRNLISTTWFQLSGDQWHVRDEIRKYRKQIEPFNIQMICVNIKRWPRDILALALCSATYNLVQGRMRFCPQPHLQFQVRSGSREKPLSFGSSFLVRILIPPPVSILILVPSLVWVGSGGAVSRSRNRSLSLHKRTVQQARNVFYHTDIKNLQVLLNSVDLAIIEPGLGS